MPWDPKDWSEEDKAKQAADAKAANKAWNKSKEKERRKRVAEELEREIDPKQLTPLSTKL